MGGGGEALGPLGEEGLGLIEGVLGGGGILEPLLLDEVAFGLVLGEEAVGVFDDGAVEAFVLPPE